MRRVLMAVLFASVISAAALARPNEQDNKAQWGKTNTRTNQAKKPTWGTAPRQPNGQWGTRRSVPVNTSVQTNNTPSGWGQGRKVGWHGDDRPPGWERRHHHHRHHWDRDHDREWRRRHHEHERH